MDADKQKPKNFSLTLGILKYTVILYSNLPRGSMPHHCLKDDKIAIYNQMNEKINSSQEFIDSKNSPMIYSYLVSLIDSIIDYLAKLPSTEADFDSFDKLNFIKQIFSIKAINILMS